MKSNCVILFSQWRCSFFHTALSTSLCQGEDCRPINADRVILDTLMWLELSMAPLFFFQQRLLWQMSNLFLWENAASLSMCHMERILLWVLGRAVWVCAQCDWSYQFLNYRSVFWICKYAMDFWPFSKIVLPADNGDPIELIADNIMVQISNNMPSQGEECSYGTRKEHVSQNGQY